MYFISKDQLLLHQYTFSFIIIDIVIIVLNKKVYKAKKISLYAYVLIDLKLNIEEFYEENNQIFDILFS